MNAIWVLLLVPSMMVGWAVGVHMGRKPAHDPRSTRSYRRDAAMAGWIDGRTDKAAVSIRGQLERKYPPGFLIPERFDGMTRL